MEYEVSPKTLNPNELAGYEVSESQFSCFNQWGNGPLDPAISEGNLERKVE